MRAVRTAMKAAGMKVESSKGEAWPGQHEINFRYADALKTADDHVVYKTGLKTLAHQCGMSVTFMAKPDHTWVGSSCHIHSSLWRGGESAFAGESDVFKHYLAGQIALRVGARDLLRADDQLVQALRRRAAGRRRRSRGRYDNRTCGFRVVGHGSSLRPETRIPGADANPYLAFAALLAAGLYGIEEKLELGPAFEGNAYESDVERFPHTLRDAIDAARARHASRGGCSATRSSTTT